MGEKSSKQFETVDGFIELLKKSGFVEQPVEKYEDEISVNREFKKDVQIKNRDAQNFVLVDMLIAYPSFYVSFNLPAFYDSHISKGFSQTTKKVDIKYGVDLKTDLLEMVEYKITRTVERDFH